MPNAQVATTDEWIEYTYAWNLVKIGFVRVCVFK